MTRKAVDVVLLPDEAMTDRAIEINAELVEKFGNEIVLNKESCLPHISLAMGCIEEADIAPVEKVLEEIANETSMSDLKVVGIRTSENSKGETVSVFELEKTPQLQSLHEKIMDRLTQYFSSDVTEDMIYGDQAVAGSTLQWIKNYREKVSFENFFPHITIGYGQIENQVQPITFVSSELALCHLGNHCTCRKVLVSIKLKGP
ncbi:MAG: 2'-5' RNA ligase family protein [Planctomycetota bacterium]|jgi:2'-5' RNA ligase